MKLYYKPGACSLAPHIALRMAGLDFTLEKVDTQKKTTESGADYLAVTPKGYVPALEIAGGEVLTEAPAVLQFIGDQKPESGLAPQPGTLERLRVQEHLNYVASELHKAYGPFFGATPISDDAKPAALANIEKKLNYFETVLSDGRAYLTGGTFTVADSYFFVVTNWSNFIGLDLGKWPHIAGYMSRVSALPAVQEALKAEGLLAA
jgi:glutathione S-transferase